ncbi:Uncharacterised protein [Aeromonas salmonicida]|uniref:DUF6037 family protein n=1 Tax=Aeromonas salmonicida TaxID=645 RepID=UPI0010255221|nr:DUF6037 family protein [Aeromonas salmonicida]VFB10071.1 Uncharacterised protein [Aeromonas salmonicida]
MKMTSLRELHKNMISIRSDMQQFQVKIGAVNFDCLFSTRDEPYFTLSLTSRGLNPKFFLFQVKPGYWITPYFGDFYTELARALNTGSGSGNKLIPKDFLELLDKNIPTKALTERNPIPNEIIRLRPDITEDRDRPYFDTWMYWKSESKKGPSKENLHKTKLVLGIDAFNFSQRMNASSKWSATPLGRDWNSHSNPM